MLFFVFTLRKNVFGNNQEDGSLWRCEMIRDKVRSILGHRNIIENFSYLSLTQLFSLLLPLITLPYLVDVLGTDYYGRVVFAQTIGTYFTILINFGFNASGVKVIANNKGSIEKVGEVFSTIFFIKSLLFVFSFLVLCVVCLLLSLSTDDLLLYLFSFLICLNELLFPQWFFQGIEKLKYSTIINLLIKSFFLILIFLIVKQPHDYLYVPLLNAIGTVIGGVVALYVVFVKERVRFRLPKLELIKEYMQDSFPLFASDLVISVKDRFNVIFIGMFLGMEGVTIYDIGVKFLSLMLIPSTILNHSVYPQMSVKRDKEMLIKLMKYSGVSYFIFTVIVQACLHWLLNLFFEVSTTNLWPIRILLLTPFVYSLSFPLARNGLIAFNEYRLLLRGIVLTTLFYLLCVMSGYILDILESVSIFSTITLAVYLFELWYRWYVCRRVNIV